MNLSFLYAIEPVFRTIHSNLRIIYLLLPAAEVLFLIFLFSWRVVIFFLRTKIRCTLLRSSVFNSLTKAHVFIIPIEYVLKIIIFPSDLFYPSKVNFYMWLHLEQIEHF